MVMYITHTDRDMALNACPCVVIRLVVIQGSCINLPSPEVRVNITGVDLLKFNTDQCLIVTDADVFPVRSGNLWLDNVYIRIASTAPSPSLLNTHVT